MARPQLHRWSFLIFVVIVTVAFCWLLLPYYGAVLWAVILAILFNPVQVWLTQRLRGRSGIAAFLSVLACICIVVIPAGIVLGLLAAEATELYDRLSGRQIDPTTVFDQLRAKLPDFASQGLERLGLGSLSEIQSRVTGLLAQASQIIATRIVSIGQNTAQLAISLGVMLYVLYFLFRDGPQLALTLRRTSPLSPRNTEHVLSRFASAVKATVKGNVIIAVIQGAIGGVALWALGVEAALLLGVVMAFLSLLPAVGAALVWVPVAIYFLLTGAVAKGLVLIGIGVFVIGLVDNLLRPPLVGKDIRLPDYLVLVSTLGGIALIGINGFVIGPLIAALFVAVWSIFANEKMAG